MAYVSIENFSLAAMREALREAGRERLRQKLVWESRECSRCDGTGQHSYNAFHGRVCFKCRGAKRVLTPAGKAARDAYERTLAERLTRTVADLKDGDSIWKASRHKWILIRSVERTKFGVRLRNANTDEIRSADSPVLIHDAEEIAKIMEELQHMPGATLVK